MSEAILGDGECSPTLSVLIMCGVLRFDTVVSLQRCEKLYLDLSLHVGSRRLFVGKLLRNVVSERYES